MAKPRVFGTAASGGKLEATGVLVLQMKIDEDVVEGEVLVAPELNQDLIFGVGLMQQWDISVVNPNGLTTVFVGHDMNEPPCRKSFDLHT